MSCSQSNIVFDFEAALIREPLLHHWGLHSPLCISGLDDVSVLAADFLSFRLLDVLFGREVATDTIYFEGSSQEALSAFTPKCDFRDLPPLANLRVSEIGFAGGHMHSLHFIGAH
jgi:hypothetical protein